MVKVALLIGVSEFADAALTNLPAALRDINAVQTVLNDAERGGFDDVHLLENPDRAQMEEAIDILFRDRQKDDLVLLYFSGHGIKDDTGKFSLATRSTEKQRLRTTAVAASFVHDVMTSAKSRRQVVILDCCFSGAFATGMTAKDDASVDVKMQLGGEGRAVLTASTATQYAFAQPDEELSIYTRFLVEGIRTGAADTDKDGHITINELHHYAQRKVQEAAPAMKPEIYAVKEGYKILLAKAPLGDPKLKYRKEVERFTSRGDVSLVGRRTLDVLQHQLSISTEEAEAIESEVLRPYREYERKLQNYGQVFSEALQHDFSDQTHEELKRFQQILGLRDEDIERVENQLVELEHSKENALRLLGLGDADIERVENQLVELEQPTHAGLNTPVSQTSNLEMGIAQHTVNRHSGNERRKPLLWAGAGMIGSTFLLGTWFFRVQWLPKTSQAPISESVSSTVNTPSDLNRLSTNLIAALAAEQLSQGKITDAQVAIETLLDRGALAQAAAVLTPALGRQADNATVNFLMGRVAWQSIKVGNKDYIVDDARRYWETAVKQQPIAQHQNALGFAWYTEGKLDRASRAWMQALKSGNGQDGSASSASQALTAYAGLALVAAKSAVSQPPSQQASLQNEVSKLRQKVLTDDPIAFQPEELDKNWMWSRQAIQDWRSVLALK